MSARSRRSGPASPGSMVVTRLVGGAVLLKLLGSRRRGGGILAFVDTRLTFPYGWAAKASNCLGGIRDACATIGVALFA